MLVQSPTSVMVAQVRYKQVFTTILVLKNRYWILLFYLDWCLDFVLGRFPRSFEFCGCYWGSGDIYMPQQRVGNQHPNIRTISKYWNILAGVCFPVSFNKHHHLYLHLADTTGDGLVVRGPAYGVRSIRIDGNDALAIYSSVKVAREMAVNEHKPIFIEVRSYPAQIVDSAISFPIDFNGGVLFLFWSCKLSNYQALTYRAGHHSTSDDSTKYRPVHEIEHWRTQRDPVTRFRKWIEGNGWWSNSTESEFRTDIRQKVSLPDFKQEHNLSYVYFWRQTD